MATSFRRSPISGRCHSSTARSGSAPAYFPPIRKRAVPPTRTGLPDLGVRSPYHQRTLRRTKRHGRAIWRLQNILASVLANLPLVLPKANPLVRRKPHSIDEELLRAYVAEGAGFEPAIRFPVYTLSRRAPSTARPPLRMPFPQRSGTLANHSGPRNAMPCGRMCGGKCAGERADIRCCRITTTRHCRRVIRWPIAAPR